MMVSEIFKKFGEENNLDDDDDDLETVEKGEDINLGKDNKKEGKKGCC